MPRVTRMFIGLWLMLLCSFASINFTLVKAEQAPFFTLYMGIPTTSTARVAWANMIATEFRKLSIDIQPFYGGWDVLIPRMLSGGNSFQNGSLDLLARFNDATYDFNPYLFYNSRSSMVNNFWVNYSESDQLIEQMMAASNRTTRLQLLGQWQDWFYSTMPGLPIFTDYQLTAQGNDITGYNPFKQFLRYEWPWYITKSGVQSATVTFAQNCPLYALSTFYISDCYSGLYASPCYDTLVRYDENMNIVPDLATSWTVTDGPNGKDTRWVINLRQGVQWQDGWEFNATDVWFTWTSIMTPDVGAMGNSWLTSLLGSNSSITITGSYQLTVDLPEANSYFLPQVMFQSGDTAHMGILPWHVFKNIPMNQWRTSTFNTGVGSYQVAKPDGSMYTAYGPIGTGPYICMGYNPTLNKVSYVLNPNYWDRANWKGNVVNFNQVYISSVDSALAALKSGEVDIMDTVFDISKKVSDIQTWATVQKTLIPRFHEMAVNNANPIIGTGVDTPLGKQDPSRAAEAAADIRIALSYAIPRQQIIDSLIIYAVPLATPLNPSMPGYKNEPVTTYNLTKAMEYMEKAGYVYAAAPSTSPSLLWEYFAGGLIIAAAAVGVVFFAVPRIRKRAKSSVRKP
jgi:ABC-type transport system substrate-binding protein